DATVPSVGDIEVAGRVEQQTGGLPHRCRGRRYAVAEKAVPSIPGDRAYRAAGRDPTHPVVARFGDVDGAGRVESDGSRAIELRAGGGSVVPGKAGRPRPGHRA